MGTPWKKTICDTVVTATRDVHWDGRLFRAGETEQVKAGVLVSGHFTGAGLVEVKDLETSATENERLQALALDLERKLADRAATVKALEEQAARLRAELDQAQDRLAVVSLEGLRKEVNRLAEQIKGLVPQQPEAEVPKKGLFGRFARR